MILLITFYIIAIFQGIVLGFVILNSSLFKSNANKYLAYAILTFSFSLLNFLLDDGLTNLYKTIPWLRIIDVLDPGILFPLLLFLFFIHQVNYTSKYSKKVFWIVIPYVTSIILSTLEIIGKNESNTSIKIVNETLSIIGLSVIFILPFTVIYSFKFIKFSKSKEEKKWLTQLWLIEMIIFISFVVTIVFAMFFNENFPTVLIMQTLGVIAGILIHWIAYSGIYKYKLAKDQKEIKALLNKQKSTVLEETSTHNKLSKTKTEALTEDNIYYKKLESLCKNDQLYRDVSLDRDKVAEKLGISPGYVSQLVNAITGDNFSTYINKFRVEAVKTLIVTPEFDNYSLLAIGLECGFSSKTTFYNTFKKITGITPNAYKKAHK